MKYNPDIHHRRSIRLKDYDYSQPGAYFITLCTQDRECLFGEIANEKMALNGAGRMVKQWWNEVGNKYPTVTIDAFVIMPNHFHGIVVIVGADLCVCPNQSGAWDNEQGAQTGVGAHIGMGAHAGAPLQRIVQWFKTMTTNAYLHGVKHHNWPPFPGKLWQRSYYDHVIRDQNEWDCIREYIAANPTRWAEDVNNPARSHDAQPKTLEAEFKGIFTEPRYRVNDEGKTNPEEAEIGVEREV